VWDDGANLVWDSGDDMERYFEANVPAYFNVSNDNNTLDNRSDNKGPEPEAIVVEYALGRWWAFIALERMSGVMLYDVCDPTSPVFVDWETSRDFTVPVADGADGLGPEGLRFVSASDSPTGSPLLLVANEISGTLDVFELAVN
jgi:hypothetical protein